jgi:hypothetical protein
MTGPRNWDKELADIDKVIASTPTAGAPPARIAGAASPDPIRSAPAGGPRKRDLFGVWLRALIGVAGAVALPFWRWGHTCGLYLYLYLASAVVIALVGLWTMRGAWTHRRGLAHVTGLLVLLYGAAFTASIILQRTSYAAVRLTWTCP